MSGPRVKFVLGKAFKPPRSKAVVPMLFLFCVAVYLTLRGVSCLVLPCSLSMCFVCIFSILITLLGEEEAGLCVYRIFICLLAMHMLICITSLFLLVSGLGCGLCLWLFLDFSVYLFACLYEVYCTVNKI